MSSNFNIAIGSGMAGAHIIGLILLLVIILFICSALLMWLWNITITRIFNVREITFWEAFRLMIIAGLLFGRGSITK